MAVPFEGQIDSVALGKITQALSLFVQNDAALRAIQALNAPRCRYLTQITVSNTVPQRIAEAQGSENFSYMVFVVETTSGSGRYTPGNGRDATTTYGIEIPAGGAVVQIEGAENIRQFSAIGNSGNLNVTYALFS